MSTKANKGTQIPAKKEEAKKTPPASAAPAQEPVKEETPKAQESAPAAPKTPGKIAQIIQHHKDGKTNKEIATFHVDGDSAKEKFHPTTISIQVTKYLKGDPIAYEKLKADRIAAKDALTASKAAEKSKAIQEKKDAKEKADKEKKEAADKAKKEAKDALAKAGAESKTGDAK